MTRWTLTDPATSETWEMPINPDTATSPHAPKSIKTAYGIRSGEDRVRSFKGVASAKSWEWSGVIRTEAHYETYVTWAAKPGEIHVTDHLGRTWEVFIEAFVPEERKPTKTTPWRYRYTVRALVMRRVS